MKLDTPQDLTGKDLFNHLISNKKELIGLKRVGIKEGIPIGFESASKSIKVTADKAVKADMNERGLVVDVIANLAGWMDYDNDVILRGAYNKSIADKGNDFPFLRDHEYKTSAIIAKTLEVYTRDFSLSELGINKSGTAQALMFKGLLDESFSGDMYAKYKHGLVKQHSIGLRYIKIDLAVNDADFKIEHEVWQKYASQVINIDKAEKEGYFWAINEIGLIENSAVVFGSNSITPTISVEEKTEAVSIDTSKVSIPEAVKDTSNKSIFEFLKCL